MFYTTGCHAQYLSGELATQEQAEHQVVRTLHVVYAFYQCYWLLSSSPFAILLNCSHPNPWVFCFSFWFSPPSHRGGGGSERVTAGSFVANWGKTTTPIYLTSTYSPSKLWPFALLSSFICNYNNLLFCFTSAFFLLLILPLSLSSLLKEVKNVHFKIKLLIWD